MQVRVFQGEVLIGTASLERLDPPMGVALGPFKPTEAYDRRQHANTVEGTYIEDFGQTLRVNAEQCGNIDAYGIAIEDFTDALGEIQLTVDFADGKVYRSLFSEYEDFKAYYPSKA